MNEATRQAGPVADPSDEGDIYSYDLVPYQSLPFPGSHPNHLAAIATIFGMKPAPVEKCRVLELGCASGGNITPMAAHLPDSQFVGVDLSSRQVEEGHKTVKAAGLKNIELRCQSIMDIDAKLGQFDYIVAHGVYSWVSEAVRTKIVSICKDNLSENGVAYVSYNTYPGWHMPQALREMILYHTATHKEPKVRVQQTRAFIKFLYEATKDQDNPYGKFLKSEVEYLDKKLDYYIFHEYLENENFPVYFYQFVESARKAGLRYVADAEVATMLAEAFPESIAKTLRTAPTIIQQEQYMDFLRNRRFRRSLLCHDGQLLDRNLKGSRLESLYITAAALPKGGAAKPDSDGKVTLALGAEREVKVGFTPLVQAILPPLWNSWPRPVRYGELVEAAKKALPKAGAGGKVSIPAEVGKALYRLYFAKVVAFNAYSPPIAHAPGARPKASELARHQARAGGSAVNLWHNQVRLTPIEARLLSMLDGKNEKSYLVKELEKIVKQARETAKARGQRVSAEVPSADRIGQEVTRALARFARAGLLLA